MQAPRARLFTPPRPLGRRTARGVTGRDGAHRVAPTAATAGARDPGRRLFARRHRCTRDRGLPPPLPVGLPTTSVRKTVVPTAMCCFLFFFAVFVYVYTLTTLRMYEVGDSSDDESGTGDGRLPADGGGGGRRSRRRDPVDAYYDYYA